LWVLAVTADPVTSGFASSLRRLGGNITGISRASDEGARHAGLAGCTPGSHRANRQENWPIIVSLANGIDNQRILPKLFSKVIYGVVVHNARRDAPVVVGFQDKGPLLIGTLDSTLGAELELVRSILARGCPTEIVDRMQDETVTSQLQRRIVTLAIQLLRTRYRRRRHDRPQVRTAEASAPPYSHTSFRWLNCVSVVSRSIAANIAKLPELLIQTKGT
jgi:Ketopantoate reductase PanE/ApbA